MGGFFQARSVGGFSSAVTGASVVSGAFHVDPDNLSGSNGGNGILIGEVGRIGGSASGVNGTGPWDLSQWFTKCSADTYIPGDLTYCWTANYLPASVVEFRGGGSAATAFDEAGSNKIIFRAYPGHTPRIDATGTTEPINGGGDGPFWMREGNFRWDHWTILTQISCWSVNSGDTCGGLEWFDIRAGKVGTTHAGDNSGRIKLGGASPTFRIRGYQTIPGMHETGTNANAAEIYMINTDDGIIENCLLRWDGSGGAVHHKRNLGTTNITIRDSLFYSGTDGTPAWKAVAAQNHHWENCILATLERAVMVHFFSDYQAGGQDPTGYQCTFDHCTLARVGTKLGDGVAIGPCTQFSDGGFGGKDGRLKNCILEDSAILMYGGTPNTLFAHNTDCDWNHYGATAPVAMYGRDGSNEYNTLAAWQAETTYSNSGHDANSVEGAIPWDTTRDPEDPLTFSASTADGSDGEPIGANVSIVGPVGAGYPLG